MLDSAKVKLVLFRVAVTCLHTFHQASLHDFTKLLHGALREIVALLCFLKPFFEARVGSKLGGTRLWDFAIHVCGRERWGRWEGMRDLRKGTWGLRKGSWYGRKWTWSL